MRPYRNPSDKFRRAARGCHAPPTKMTVRRFLLRNTPVVADLVKTPQKEPKKPRRSGACRRRAAASVARWARDRPQANCRRLIYQLLAFTLASDHRTNPKAMLCAAAKGVGVVMTAQNGGGSSFGWRLSGCSDGLVPNRRAPQPWENDNKGFEI